MPESLLERLTLVDFKLAVNWLEKLRKIYAAEGGKRAEAEQEIAVELARLQLQGCDEQAVTSRPSTALDHTRMRDR